MANVAGFTYWELLFNEEGQPVMPDAVASCAREVADQRITDLFVFSHGWNNNPSDARALYERFFGSARSVLNARPAQADKKAGIAGVIWPSILFPDDQPAADATDAAGLEGAEAADAVDELKKVFPGKTAVLDEMAKLLADRPDDLAALERFQALLRELAPASSSDEERHDRALLTERPETVFDAMSDIAPPQDRLDAAGFGDPFAKLWSGAKEALRVTSYWTMKERAGVVGERGLAPFLIQLDGAGSGLRIHLVGHSFGARLVSFSLKGLPAAFTGARSPIKSLTLIQGAFSHFSFADSLPHDHGRSGALKAMASRVDGPIVVTHSVHDLAVFQRYPQASFIAGQDAADADDRRFRFGAMGADGAQAVNAATAAIGPVGQAYALAKGEFLNLNGDDLITQGDPPSGAHTDIFYPEIAWAVLQASGVVVGG